MFEGDLWNAAEVAKLETAQAERRAAESHRFRDIKTPEAKVLTAIITGVLGLFLR